MRNLFIYRIYLCYVEYKKNNNKTKQNKTNTAQITICTKNISNKYIKKSKTNMPTYISKTYNKQQQHINQTNIKRIPKLY